MAFDLGGFAGGLAQGFSATWRPDLVDKVRARKEAQDIAEAEASAKANEQAKKDFNAFATEVTTKKGELEAVRAQLANPSALTEVEYNKLIGEENKIKNYFRMQGQNPNKTAQMSDFFVKNGDFSDMSEPVVSTKIMDVNGREILGTFPQSIAGEIAKGRFVMQEDGTLGERTIENGKYTNTIIPTKLSPIPIKRDQDKIETLKAYKNGKPKIFNTREEYTRAVNEDGYTPDKPEKEDGYTSKDISKKKLELAKLTNQLNTAKEKGDNNTVYALEDSIQSVKDEIVYMTTGSTPAIPTEKSFTPMDVINKTSNNAAINSAINKLVQQDEKAFRATFTELGATPEGFATQVKMIGSGNQYAAKAWIDDAKDVVFNAQTEPSVDDKGFKIRPSQVLNQKKLEIQAMDINKEIKDKLLVDLERQYTEVVKAQAKDKDSSWYTGTLVESIVKSLPFGDTEAQFEDSDARKLSFQQLIEDKADYGKEYIGNIKLDKDMLYIGRADRFETQTKPALKLIYEKTTGRELTDQALDRILEEGMERSKFEFDMPFGGQEGRVKKGTELEQLLNLIFKTKKGK